MTEVATWNDNGSSYNTRGDKGIMIIAGVMMMMMLMITLMMTILMIMIFKLTVAVIQLIGTIKMIGK